MTTVRKLVHDLCLVLEQGRRLVERLDAETYALPLPPLAAYGPGAHLRHALDVLVCLVDGLPEGRVDYDRRARDERIEREPRLAARGLAEARERVAALGALDPDLGLCTRMDAPAGTPAQDGWTRSTCARELSFVLSHTIHHYALIALVLRARGVQVDEEFGVAPSTLRYWKETGRCALPAG
jgi:hypothetical protein